MKRYLFIYAMAGVFAIATAVTAQGPPPTPNPQTPSTPQTQPQKPSPTTPPTQQATQPATGTVTVEGCLLREQDIGRQPNVAERAGIQEDFILTNAKMIKGTAPSDVARTGQTPGQPSDAARAGQQPTGASASLQPMYDVRELDADRLKTFVGKRVQIEGTWGDTQRSPSAGAKEDLVDLKGTTIREVPGTCTPPKP